MTRLLFSVLSLGIGASALLLGQQSVTVDFETLPEGQAAAGQIAGYTFANATVLQSGASLNEIEFPPHSGNKVVCDIGGPITITFASPVGKFMGYFTHGQNVQVQAFSAGGQLLSGASTATPDNRQGSSGTPNELVTVGDSVQPITRVVLTGTSGGSSFTLDDIGIVPYVAPSPAFSIDVTRMTFDAVFGRQAPPPQGLLVTAEPDTLFTITSSAPWLRPVSSSTRTPANVSISVVPGTMDPGTYQAAVTFSNTRNASLLLLVTMRISGKPSLTSVPSTFTFKYKKGDPAPAAQQLYVAANNANVDYFILTKDPWVKVTPDFSTTGVLSFRHQVTVDASKLDPGHYESAVFVYSNEATNSPLTIPIILDVAAATAGPGN